MIVLSGRWIAPPLLLLVSACATEPSSDEPSADGDESPQVHDDDGSEGTENGSDDPDDMGDADDEAGTGDDSDATEEGGDTSDEGNPDDDGVDDSTDGDDGTTDGDDTEDDGDDSGDTDGGSDSGEDDDGGDDGGAWRPFDDSSPWNTKIPSNPALEPDSDALIEHFAASSQWPFISINIDSFGIPVYWADADTPWENVDVVTVAGQGFDMDPRAPIPEGAAPDPQSDRHLCIIDKDAGTEWGFFGAVDLGDSWQCDVCATADLTGSGVRPPKDSGMDWWLSHGARACGYPLIAGLITVEEMQAGRIDHALVMAYPGIRSRYYRSPASTAQATFDQISPTSGIPCGGRIQLDPALDLDSLGLSDSGKVIARALQEYGAYIGDYSGAMSLYAEGSPNAQTIWGGGLLDTYEVRDEIDLSWFRVLEIGTLKDDGN